MFIEENCFDLAWGIYSFDQWIVKDKSDKTCNKRRKYCKSTGNAGKS